MTDLVVMPELSSLLELAGRATIVFGIALAFAWLIRKGSATTRHHLWTLAFALLLVLPVLTLAGPSWDVPLLPSAGRAVDEALVEPLADPAPSELATPTGAFPFSATIDAAVPATTEARPHWRVISLPLLLWAVGCGAALVSVGVGIFRFQKLARSARPVDDPEWHRQLEAVQRELGFRSDVSLRLGGETITPMTGGMWSPVILLPTSASGWSAARRAVVLTHELVHVRRRDALRQLLGRVVLALYWFHPLSWVASRLAATSREEACDEEVLATGPRPSEYARHLLALAQNTGQSRAVMALPIVNAPPLERRIGAIVKFNRPRRRRLVTVVVLTALGAAGMTASCANPVPVKTAPASGRASTAQDFGGWDCSFVTADKKWRWSYKQGMVTVDRIWPWRPKQDGVLCMGVRGDVVMSRDALEVRAIGPGGAVALESAGRRSHVLEITQGPDGLEYDWRIDGRKQAFDESARQFRDLMLASFRGPSWGASGIWGRNGGPHGRVHVNRAVAGMRGQAASLRREVAGLLGQMATYRAEELSLRSALLAASNARTRVALEGEINERVVRTREVKKRIDEFELSAIEAEIQFQIERYDDEGDARDLASALRDPETYLKGVAKADSNQDEIDALRDLINDR